MTDEANGDAPEPVLERVEHSTLIEALSAAQAEFPRIEKTHEADVRKDGQVLYTYKYADLGDVLAACRPVLARHGIALTQSTDYTEGGRLMLLTEIEHVSGQVKRSRLELAASPGNPQQFGGSLTYLRRYQAVTLLGVAAEQDLDAADVEPIRSSAQSAPPPAPLPDWARPASGDKRRELLDALEPIIGSARAATYVDAVAQRCGYLPAVAVTAVRSIAKAVVDELDPLAFEAAARTREAKAAAQAQDHAAEAPDAPAPEPAVDRQEDAALESEQAELEAAAAAAAEAGVDYADLDELPPAAAGDHDAEPGERRDLNAKLAPASIAKPERTDDDTDRDYFSRLRLSGCICDNPLAADDSADHDGACPIVGHGIPF